VFFFLFHIKTACGFDVVRSPGAAGDARSTAGVVFPFYKKAVSRRNGQTDGILLISGEIEIENKTENTDCFLIDFII